MKMCKVKNCDNKQHAKGLCMRHYTQVRKHGYILNRTIFDLNEFVDCGDYYEIKLYNNRSQEIARAKIDKKYYNQVKNYKWRLNSYGYIKTNHNTLSLHNLITEGYHKISNYFINGDKTDCRRANLRFFKGATIKLNIDYKAENNDIFNLFEVKKKEKKCKVKNCNNKHHANGYCAKHDAQFKKYGHILSRTRFDANGITAYSYHYGIHLYNNKGIVKGEVKIDKKDYNLIKDYRWRLNYYGHVITGRKNVCYLYNLFFNIGDNETIKFINGNKLDNRRHNLRRIKKMHKNIDKNIPEKSLLTQE